MRSAWRRREDLGPQALVRGGFSNMVEYPIRVTTQMFEIEGIMELPGRFDFTGLDDRWLA